MCYTEEDIQRLREESVRLAEIAKTKPGADQLEPMTVFVDGFHKLKQDCTVCREKRQQEVEAERHEHDKRRREYLARLQYLHPQIDTLTPQTVPESGRTPEPPSVPALLRSPSSHVGPYTHLQSNSPPSRLRPSPPPNIESVRDSLSPPPPPDTRSRSASNASRRSSFNQWFQAIDNPSEPIRRKTSPANVPPTSTA